MINNDKYLLQVSKYIHNNPVKAGMVKKAVDYQWSSYPIYVGRGKDIYKLIDSSRILGSISKSKHLAVRKYADYVSEEEPDLMIMDVEDDLFVEHSTDYIFNMVQAEKRINCILSNKAISYEELIKNIELRNEAIKVMRKNSSLTLKQIGQLFGGISESRIKSYTKE